MIPAGGTVTSVNAPAGWSCAQINAQNQVSCWYNGTIAAGSAAPDVVIAVTPAAGTSTLSATTTVTPQGATDPNPADDTVTTTTSLADLKLDGGGLGCNAVPGSAPAAGSGLLTSLLALLGLRRRRSR
jgi:MYXO-CTERM domain-containing protein